MVGGVVSQSVVSAWRHPYRRPGPAALSAWRRRWSSTMWRLACRTCWLATRTDREGW